MLFQDILRLNEISEREVALCLHKPSDPVIRRTLAVLAEERADLFDAYQATHGELAEATVRSRRYFASFLSLIPGEATFLGLFEREIGPVLTEQDWLRDERLRDMNQRVDGHRATVEEKARQLAGRTFFNLHRLPVTSAFEKRLTCRDPGGRNYLRRADTTPLEVLEYAREGRVAPPMPQWRELALTRAELSTLPRDWEITLRAWRGVYLIVDEEDGARYVGSAYGLDNLLGRWRQHIAGDRGITVELSKRSPARFRFSILELVSPTAPDQDVIAAETTWKLRLDTLRFGLNEN
ncbi:GIY-YIG nuclease family protein [Salipiger bermudensis]|uniref:GIY-YIG nuclease family protein n=1 Tax=Salipiger bermudensis TaxID=344736 RepID=UPI001CD3F4FC|nr:GIY-YIG nuclease family protein [Salipiger bermudensis]MCA1286516.1 GIY-YIG nuclease family protein [Salipiger bermudensis]